jgi:hypothetical protein
VKIIIPVAGYGNLLSLLDDFGFAGCLKLIIVYLENSIDFGFTSVDSTLRFWPACSPPCSSNCWGSAAASWLLD